MERTNTYIISCKERIKPNLTELFWLFIVGCIVGTLWEELLTVIVEHKFESRAGLVYGPFNPVYGVGAVAFTMVLAPMSDRRAGSILLVGALVGGGFEYLCSFVQEMFFGTVSWDYSDIPLNINGRTNLPYMLFWGAAGLLWVRVLPYILGVIDRLPHLRLLTAAMAVFMVLNIAVSVVVNMRVDERREGMQPSNSIEQLIDSRFTDERIARIYPNAKVIDYPAA